MSQSLSQVMGQYMRMEQRLTPQLIQAMDILQLGVMALENRIAEELEKNCALEVVEDEKVAPEHPTHEGNGQTATADAESESFKRLDRLTREYDFDIDGQSYFVRRRA